MQIADFALERYFARWEFQVRYVLCASDLEPYPLPELLALADAPERALWDNLRLGYTESLGHPLLRAEIGRQYSTVAADDVITFTGAEEGIFLAAHALLAATDHAVIRSRSAALSGSIQYENHRRQLPAQPDRRPRVARGVRVPNDAGRAARHHIVLR